MMFKLLFKGEYEVVKLPFKPKDSEFYYYVSLYTGRVTQDMYIENNDADEALVKSGNCYRTKEEITPEVLEETWQKCYGAYFQGDKQDGAHQ